MRSQNFICGGVVDVVVVVVDVVVVVISVTNIKLSQ